ncbi:hypothetical protein BDZ89DRAFT_1076344 [Hymenopellis radicata]|nr:hypothetical protein BDZ89DRAFT_1076344 [Hymenopellis radicata]
MKRLSARIPMKAIYSKEIFKTRRGLREAEKNRRGKAERETEEKQKRVRRNSRLRVLRAAWSPEG